MSVSDDTRISIPAARESRREKRAQSDAARGSRRSSLPTLAGAEYADPPPDKSGLSANPSWQGESSRSPGSHAIDPAHPLRSSPTRPREITPMAGVWGRSPRRFAHQILPAETPGDRPRRQKQAGPLPCRGYDGGSAQAAAASCPPPRSGPGATPDAPQNGGQIPDVPGFDDDQGRMW